MSLLKLTGDSHTGGAPRVSGDEPAREGGDAEKVACSPRERG
ncbi:hypothetical protein [Corynebacterium sp. HMSC055A01]|nr:hypothetical protein [Corynebacterium sp. HMSC055A01]